LTDGKTCTAMNKIYYIDEIGSKTKDIFLRNNVAKAYLFGSYAHGNPDEASDIDIALDTGGNISFLRVCGVMEEISSMLKKKVDLFDFREIKKDSGIMKEIVQRGVLLYEAQ
jgi:predicted nucleotidyltransferase